MESIGDRDMIFLSAKEAYDYVKATNDRLPEAEDIIKDDFFFSYLYAKNILHDRFHKGEYAIVEQIRLAVDYAIDVIYNRWPEAEEKIRGNKILWEQHQKGDRVLWNQYRPEPFKTQWLRYVEFLKLTKTDEDKWIWLIKDGVNEYLIDILNYTKMTPDMQEFVIQKRPDLINFIRDLDPILKEKHTHETSLATIEV
jgi:hypothetical protein